MLLETHNSRLLAFVIAPETAVDLSRDGDCASLIANGAMGDDSSRIPSFLIFDLFP
jgi:hypothetical protein